MTNPSHSHNREKRKIEDHIKEEIRKFSSEITIEDFAEFTYNQKKKNKFSTKIDEGMLRETDDEELTDHQEEVCYYNGYYGCRLLDNDVGYRNLKNYGY